MTLKVLIADDHAVVRAGLRMLIDMQADMKVVETASDGKEAYEKALAYRPDVVLMDLNMEPGENGIETTARLKEAAPSIEVLILTMHDDREYLYKVLKAGASGYILKNADEMDVMHAIRTVHRGDVYLYPNAAKSIIQDFLKSMEGGPAPAYEALTSREREVLVYIAKGYSNKEISEQLFLSVKTVEMHKSNIMDKLQLRTRHELVSYAHSRGLLKYSD